MLSLTAHHRVTGPAVVAAFRAAATAYGARPKAAPGDRTGDAHDRVRRDKVSKTGNVTLRTGGRGTTSASAAPTPEPASCS